MLKLISLKTEIARSVNGPKLQGPHAEEANGEAVPRAANFGDLKTADHVNTIHPAPEIQEHFMIQKGYGTLCTSSCTI